MGNVGRLIPHHFLFLFHTKSAFVSVEFKGYEVS